MTNFKCHMFPNFIGKNNIQLLFVYRSHTFSLNWSSFIFLNVLSLSLSLSLISIFIINNIFSSAIVVGQTVQSSFSMQASPLSSPSTLVTTASWLCSFIPLLNNLPLLFSLALWSLLSHPLSLSLSFSLSLSIYSLSLWFELRCSKQDSY